MKAIIMAGGEGSRLRPLTCEKPKPMANIMNRPAMEHMIGLLRRKGITDIAVTLQYLPSKIRDYFGDGQRFGVTLTHFTENEPLGTAGSVKNATDFIREPFLVISGDAITDLALDEAIAFHQEKKAAVTIVTKKVENPTEYGIVVTDQHKRIVQFLEKPQWSEVFSDTVNTGIYIIEPKVMELVKSGQNMDFSKDVFPKLLLRGEPMYSFETEAYWCDIGDLEAYRQCQFDWMKGEIRLPLGAKEIEKGVWAEQDVFIADGARMIPPVYLGAASSIGAGSTVGPYSVIGSDVTIGKMTRIEGSIIQRKTRIRDRAVINGAILGEGVQVKSGCAIYDMAVVGDGASVGEDALLRSGVKIWAHKQIEEGEDIAENLVWGHFNRQSLFHGEKVEGEINTDLTPETAVQIAAAFGSQYPDGKFALSCGSGGGEYMLLSALTAGLLSSGVQVLDFGQQPLAITRAGIRFYNLSGGIHVGSGTEKNQAAITILNAQGANLSRDGERKLQQVYQRGDFRRANGENIREKVDMHSYKLYYLRDVVNKCKNRRLSFRILVNTSDHLSSSLILSLMRDLQCECTIDMHNLSEKENMARFAEKCKNYDLGAVIGYSDDHLILFDEKGRMISEELFQCMCALIILRSKQSGVYAAPVSAPGVLEIMASRYGGKILRTKSSSLDVMEEICKDQKTFSLSHQFVLEFDPIGGLIGILDFLQSQGETLGQLVDEIPKFYIRKSEAPCTSGQRGMLIRKMMEQSAGKETATQDGVKIYEKGGWVLVLPNSGKTGCRVICEGYSEEIAEELTGTYMKKIEKILKDAQK